MTALRTLVESDLGDTIEGEFGTPIVLIGPDGTKYAASANNPALPLLARVVYDQRSEHLSEASGLVVLYEMTVTLRRSSLPRIPAAGENWGIRVPQDPTAGAPIATRVLGPARVPQGGRSIGYIQFFPREGVQTP